MPQEVDKTYFELAGAVINQALWDYKNIRRAKRSYLSKGTRLKLWHNARKFLFSNRLEMYLEKFALDHILNAPSIRKLAQ